MKNMKKILLAFLAAGFIYSCEDAYNIRQEGENTSDIAILTIADMQLYLQELYDNITTEDIIGFTSVFTDETAIGFQNGGQNLEEYRFQLFPTNDYASTIWLQNYNLIDDTNRMIQGSQSVIIDPEADDAADLEAEKNRILGEARLMRAFAHFQLLTFYSTDLTDDNALGVIIMDHVAPTLPNNEQLPRSTNGEVFDFIEQDLQFAEANMTIGNSNIYLTPRFITALRARIALYRGQYAQAITFADQAISQPGPGLATRAQYSSVFIPVAGEQSLAAEVIFALERPLNKRGIVSNWFFNNATLAGGPFLEVSRSLYDALRATPGDIRTDVVVAPEPLSLIADDYETVFEYRRLDQLILRKYPGNPARNLPLNNRISVFRVAELYLIKAEAQVHLNDLVGARTTLNTLRANRISGLSALPNFADATQGFRAVLDERRKELAFEGHRYIDLKRLGTLAGVPGVQRYIRDCSPYGACELLVTDHRFTLPIPNDELNGNATIRPQQNPGY